MNPMRDEKVRISFPLADGAVERLWATPLGTRRYRIENAPALLFGVSLHDVVEAHSDDDGSHWAVRVAERGPVMTVRILLDVMRPRSIRLRRMLESLGCAWEQMNPAWFAAFTSDAAAFGRLVEQLAGGGYAWEYVNPKRADVEAAHPTASAAALGPPEIDAANQAVLHFAPPWLERADDEVEVMANVDVTKQRPELLPARRLDERLWELCCTPFLADGLALGDVVEVDTALRLLRPVTRSGRSSLLVSVAQVEDVAAVQRRLQDIGCLVESRFRGSRALAVDCASLDVFARARTLLDGHEGLTYEVMQPPSTPQASGS